MSPRISRTSPYPAAARCTGTMVARRSPTANRSGTDTATPPWGRRGRLRKRREREFAKRSARQGARRPQRAQRGPSAALRRRRSALSSASDREALAALGATSRDDGTAPAGLHAHEKPVSAGAAGLRGLVGAFHGWAWDKSGRESGKPAITARKSLPVNELPRKASAWHRLDSGATTVDNHALARCLGLHSNRSRRTCPQ